MVDWPAPLSLPANGTVVVKMNALGAGHRRSIESAIRSLRHAGIHCEIVMPEREIPGMSAIA